MRKITFSAVVALLWLMGSAAYADEHEYVNGICQLHTECDKHFERPEQDADGFYLLRNAGNVEWISDQVAAALIDLDCKLMNDIDFEGIENLHRPIGPNNAYKYNATFDGQGFRIKNMIINRPNSEKQGFFGSLRGNPNGRGKGTVIKNLIIDKSCSITGGLRTGGITGSGQNNEKEIIIMNCVNEAEINTPSKNAGGITGGSDSNHPMWKIYNCINTGKITSTGDGESAGISGWLGDNGSTVVRNCFNIGQVEGVDGSGRGVFRASADRGVNCFDFSGMEDAWQYLPEDQGLTLEDLGTGKLAYYLNTQAGETVFYQTLGEDAYPVPFNTSLQVYLQGELDCAGNPLEGGTYTNNPVAPDIPPHEYADGDYHCVNCGHVSDDFCKIVDDYYQLNTALDVCWFAELVKAGHTEVNARLNSDIDFSDYPEYSGIGDRNHGFKGVFDGGFHTISNMDMSWREGEEWVGFINFLNGGATVKNLRCDETCIINALGNAGLVGGSTAPGDIYLVNLGFEGDVSCSRSGAGGIIGCNTGSQAIIHMTNCYSTGFISGSEVMENGALSAWLGGSGAVITNCWSSATVIGVQNYDKYLARFDNATFTNCYSLNGTPLQCSLFEYEDLESGALCYRLNGKQDNIIYYQNIGEDQFPTFLPDHKRVYAIAEMRCDGTFLTDDVTYTNDENSVTRPDHQFVDGFCSVCHQQDADFPFLDVLANADHDVATGYETINSGGGSGLAINNSVAEHWNMQWFETFQTITGLQPGIYRLRVQGLQRVQSWNEGQDGNKEGDAYEFGELSQSYVPLYHSSQYFAEVSGKKIANRFKDIAEDAQTERVNETEAYNAYTDKYAPNSLAACRKYFAKGLYWNAPIYFAVASEADSIKIGVENCTYLYGNWTVWDSWRLDKVEDGTAELIRMQQAAAIQEDLDELEAQTSLVEAYNDAKDVIQGATDLNDILAAADVLSRNPNLIRKSHEAYKKYEAAIEAIKAERESRDDLFGVATDLLDTYLDEIAEAGEELPNGSYISIMSDKLLDVSQLEEEAVFAKALLDRAIMTSVVEGSDVSNVVKNADFAADGNFKDWVKTQIKAGSEGSNFNSNTGFTDIYPVAGTWNTAFDVHQDIEVELPNGIYELEAPAFYRPGGNLEGDQEGNDYVPADLYINDWFTPVMNIYAGRIPFGEAVNGVNGRFDPNDPSIPHAGEATGSYEYETFDGYVPEQRQAVSFAFAAPGRYTNKVYGLVTDGKLTVGIRNTGKPWYPSGMTMWGKFKLTYMGNSETALDAMIQTFETRLDALQRGREFNEMYISLSHIENLTAYIAEAQAAGSFDEKLAAAKKVNDEFNLINGSYDAYRSLYETMEYCQAKYDELAEENPEMSNAFLDVADEITNHILEGDLSDEDAANYRENILNDPKLGGGFYVQGDLLDAEGNDLSYSTRNTVYPMIKQEDGTYTATVKVQDRSAKANANARAGIFISRMDEVYRVEASIRRFITPEGQDTFILKKGAGNDLQMAGGEVKITFNPATGETKTEVIDYKWYDNVFVVGSIINKQGEQHRWRNDEMAPLAHKGNGVYEGVVTFFQDPNDNMFANFTIMACRSNMGDVPNSTVTRGSWTECRYGSDETRWPLQNGVPADNLLRGLDRSWHLDWGTCTEETQSYRIVFDMNHATITAYSMLAPDGDANGDGVVTIQDAVAVLEAMAADSNNPAADVNKDGVVTIQDVVYVLEVMAAQ